MEPFKIERCPKCNRRFLDYFYYVGGSSNTMPEQVELVKECRCGYENHIGA